MAQIDAELFIKAIVKDNGIRKSLYNYDTAADIMAAIREMGYKFILPDFEESIHHLKIESPTQDQADMLDELLMWWHMLTDDGTIEPEEPSSCSPSKCSTCSICG